MYAPEDKNATYSLQNQGVTSKNSEIFPLLPEILSSAPIFPGTKIRFSMRTFLSLHRKKKQRLYTFIHNLNT